MFAVNLQVGGLVGSTGGLGIVLLLIAFMQCLATYLTLNISVWLSNHVGTKSTNSPLWGFPLPFLAFTLLCVAKGTEFVSRKYTTGAGERTQESLLLDFSARVIVSALFGGLIVRNSLEVAYWRGVVIAAITAIASDTVAGILLSLLLNWVRIPS